MAVLSWAVCGCARPSPAPPERFAAISGVVMGPAPGSASRRPQVSATNIATHRTYRVRASREGVFALLVPAGTYRLGVSLGRNETVVELPPDVGVGAGESKSDVNIVIGTTGR